MKIQRVAAYGIITRVEKGSPEILLTRLAPQTSAAGCWTLPGGGLQFGEDPESAMIREVKEETGLEVSVNQIAGVNSECQYRDGKEIHGVRILYFAKVVSGELISEANESTDMVAWHPILEVHDLPQVSLVGIGVKLALSTHAR